MVYQSFHSFNEYSKTYYLRAKVVIGAYFFYLFSFLFPIFSFLFSLLPFLLFSFPSFSPFPPLFPSPFLSSPFFPFSWGGGDRPHRPPPGSAPGLCSLCSGRTESNSSGIPRASCLSPWNKATLTNKWRPKTSPVSLCLPYGNGNVEYTSNTCNLRRLRRRGKSDVEYTLILR